jgi:hypothetical protein
MPIQSGDNAKRAARKSRLVHVAYLAAIAVAMLGWLWLIAWSAMQLV